MYRANELITGLYHLWGWRQNTDTLSYKIADGLTISDTGQFYQDVHPLLTLDNIKAIAPAFDTMTYADWNELTPYRQGDKVLADSKAYIAKEANQGADPGGNPELWGEYDPFSEWLEIKTKASLLKAIRTFWDSKAAQSTAKNILENKTLFNGAGRLIDTIPNASDIVGFEIVPLRINGVTTKIEKIGLQFTGTGPIKLYLMHSSSAEPVKEITLTRTKAGSMEWFTVADWYLPYQGDTDAGGSWYLVYRQSELPVGVQAINKSRDWSAKPCSYCDYAELAAWRIWSRYLEVHPFKVADPDSELAIWDLSRALYTYNLNYGINIQLSVLCDVTEIILEQKLSFQSVLGLQVAVDMLREMAYNPSFNIGRAQQNLSRVEILYELDGDSQSMKKSGLVYSLTKAMEAASLDMHGLSKVCFPCNNKGLKYRTV